MSEQSENTIQPNENSIELTIVESTSETENLENEKANIGKPESEIAETEKSGDLSDPLAVGEQNSRSPVVQERVNNEPQP